MDITTLLQFFNKEKPCPQEIVNCESLREEYFKDLINRTSQTNCIHCAQVEIRDKYIRLLTK